MVEVNVVEDSAPYEGTAAIETPAAVEDGRMYGPKVDGPASNHALDRYLGNRQEICSLQR